MQGRFIPASVDVLTLSLSPSSDEGKIAAVTGFLTADLLGPQSPEGWFSGAELFARFGLPADPPLPTPGCWTGAPRKPLDLRASVAAAQDHLFEMFVVYVAIVTEMTNTYLILVLIYGNFRRIVGILQPSGEDVSLVLETARGRTRIEGEAVLSTFDVSNRPDMPNFPALAVTIFSRSSP